MVCGKLKKIFSYFYLTVSYCNFLFLASSSSFFLPFSHVCRMSLCALSTIVFMLLLLFPFFTSFQTACRYALFLVWSFSLDLSVIYFVSPRCLYVSVCVGD